MTVTTQSLSPHWQALKPVLSMQTKREYNRAVKALNALLDEIGTNERHPMFGLLDTLGTLIHAYEQQHVRMPSVPPAEALRYLIDEHGLAQAELPEIGSQGVVSEVLNGKRELNTRQIRALANRFGVSPAIFI